LLARQAPKKEVEMPSPRKIVAQVGLLIAGGLSLSACATTDYVDEQVATVNNRVSALETRVQQVESTAQGAASSAQQANQRIDQLTGRMDSMEQRMAAKPPRN
jgi:murein lipoprotein